MSVAPIQGSAARPHSAPRDGSQNVPPNRAIEAKQDVARDTAQGMASNTARNAAQGMTGNTARDAAQGMANNMVRDSRRDKARTAAQDVARDAGSNRVRNLAGRRLVAPAVFFLFVLIIGPAMAIFGMALTDWQFGARELSFIGLRNFRELFSDAGFYQSIRNTGLYTLIVVPGTVGLGLLIALLIESGQSLRAFYRAVHFLPFMATLAAMAVAWEALLHPTIGLANQLLKAMGWPTANWLRDSATVLPVLAIIGIWQNLGFAMVLFLAGLKAIPQDLYDAAAIDGADRALDRLRIVTLPMLGPTTMFVLIVVALRALEAFDTVNILTQGGPGKSSEVLLYTLYVESFQYLRTGYGAAITVVFLVIVIALTLVQVKVMDRKVHYA